MDFCFESVARRSRTSLHEGMENVVLWGQHEARVRYSEYRLSAA